MRSASRRLTDRRYLPRRHPVAGEVRTARVMRSPKGGREVWRGPRRYGREPAPIQSGLVKGQSVIGFGGELQTMIFRVSLPLLADSLLFPAPVIAPDHM